MKAIWFALLSFYGFQMFTPAPVLLYTNVAGIATPVTSAAATGQINYTPTAVLAKCMNGATVVDCSFGSGGGAATSVKTGSASNTDTAGTVTLAATTTSSPAVTFTGTYASNPVCTFFTQNATTTQTAALGVIATQVSTTSTFATVSTAPAANITLGYTCISRN